MTDKQKIKYPTVEEIDQANDMIIKEINVSRKDYHRVYHKDRIVKILEEMKNIDGDIYDKAVFLLKNLIITHPFGSANRRTAYVVTHTFLWENIDEAPHIKLKDEKFLESIRHGWVTDEEVKLWLQGKTTK